MNDQEQAIIVLHTVQARVDIPVALNSLPSS